MTDEVSREGLQQKVLDLQAALAVKEEQVAARAAELAQIRALMHQVTVYEGLVDASDLVMMVSDLVRDHDSLETRIENALHYCADLEASPLLAEQEPWPAEMRSILEQVIHLLRGGSPVPDTIEELES